MKIPPNFKSSFNFIFKPIPLPAYADDHMHSESVVMVTPFKRLAKEPSSLFLSVWAESESESCEGESEIGERSESSN